MDETFVLSAENWPRIQDLLAEALELAPHERARFFDHQCGGDGILRREMDALIEAYSTAADFLERLDVARIGALLDNRDDDRAGDRIGPYRVIRLLGRGGMGVVYLAEDTRLHRHVALKFLPLHLAADETAKQRFLAEARASAALDHPNIGVIHEIGETEDGQHYIALAYYDGGTLREKIRRERLAISDAVDLIGQVARGIREAHRRGSIHCDVKPSNILITPGVAGGEGIVVKLVDFGISRFLGMHTMDGTYGTISYMAPEQTLGQQLDVRTDVWSLGVVLYEILTGRQPFDGATNEQLMDAIQHGEPEPVENVRPDVPPVLGQIIQKCLRKSVHERYPNMDAFLKDLERFDSTRPAPGGSTRTGMTRRRLSMDRLMVLPLQNLCPEPADEYFASGITNELISRLSRLGGLRLIGRTSSFHYANTTKRISEIGLELDVPVILSGSLRKMGDDLHVTIELVDTKTEELLWSEIYDERTSAALNVQRDIAEKVAKALKLQVESAQLAQLWKTDTRNRDAYENYLKGRYFVDRFDEPSVALARDHFQRALDLDPSFAEAWSGLSDAYKAYDYLAMLPPKEAASRARAAAERALEIDPELAAAHTSLATVLADYYWDWDGAGRHYRRAIELNPVYATGRQAYAEYLRDMGRFEEAFKEIRIAQELDPLSPFYLLVEGTILLMARRPTEASEVYDQLVSSYPTYTAVHFYRALAHLQVGQVEAALATLDLADPERNSPDALTLRGGALVMLGRMEEARAVEAALDILSKHRFVSGFHHAYMKVALGDLDAAFALLEQAIDERSWFVRLLRSEPSLDLLRSDSRYVTLLKKVGLADWPKRPS